MQYPLFHHNSLSTSLLWISSLLCPGVWSRTNRSKNTTPPRFREGVVTTIEYRYKKDEQWHKNLRIFFSFYIKIVIFWTTFYFGHGIWYFGNIKWNIVYSFFFLWKSLWRQAGPCQDGTSMVPVFLKLWRYTVYTL